MDFNFIVLGWQASPIISNSFTLFFYSTIGLKFNLDIRFRKLQVSDFQGFESESNSILDKLTKKINGH